jgi:hypothetical protein
MIIDRSYRWRLLLVKGPFMVHQAPSSPSWLLLLGVSLSLLAQPSTLWAQANNNNNNNNNGGGVAGIDIDADGVLRVRQTDPRLALMQRQAAIQKRGGKSIQSSPMRKRWRG